MPHIVRLGAVADMGGRELWSLPTQPLAMIALGGEIEVPETIDMAEPVRAVPVETLARMAVAKVLGLATADELPPSLIVRGMQDGMLPVFDDDPPDAQIVGVVFTPRDPIEETTFEICGLIGASEARQNEWRYDPSASRRDRGTRL